MDPLFLKALRDLRGQLIGWSAALAALLALIIALYPLVGDVYAALDLPPELLAFFGPGTDLGTINGWIALEFFSYAHLVLAIFAILAGTAALMGDEADGSLDLLLAQPVARGRIVLVRSLALAIGLAMICLVLLGTSMGTAAAFGIDLPAAEVAVALLSLWIFSLAVGMTAMALSVITGDRRTSGSLVAVVLVASYLVESMANLLPDLEPFRPVLATTYYEGVATLTASTNWLHVGAVGFSVLAALLLTLFLFDRRDLGVSGQWLARFRRTPAASRS